jgi:hypothetical protein
VSGKYIADKNDDCKFKQIGSFLTNSHIQRQNKALDAAICVGRKTIPFILNKGDIWSIVQLIKHT